MHLPAQGAEVAVGTGALRENAELDGELHDFMPLREFTQPSTPPPLTVSVPPPGCLPSSFVAGCTDASSLGCCSSLSEVTEGRN